MNGAAIFGWARLLAPIILARIPQTAAIAPKIGPMMDEAEQLKDAKGIDKLNHVKTESALLGDAINAERPGTVDTVALNSAVENGINTAFDIAKVAAANHGAPLPDTAAA